MSKYKLDERKYTERIVCSYYDIMRLSNRPLVDIIDELTGFVDDNEHELILKEDQDYYCGGSDSHFTIYELIPEPEEVWKKRMANNKINRRQRRVKDNERKEVRAKELREKEVKEWERLNIKYGEK